MPSLFSKIVAGEIPCHKVAENDEFLAFLDIFPLVIGHTLVIPKQEVDYIFDVPEGLYERLWAFARQTARAVEAAIPCERVGVAVIGLEVPHAHIHLVPLNHVGDINFERAKLSPEPGQLAEAAEKIRGAYDRL
ncbi:MAG: HIT family protein [Flavobacteriales bacterium]|nr:HIT family protein [Flavobacteriales bacterium]MCB9448425.1 HIT family protein [Flavobacteriales bacterium]